MIVKTLSFCAHHRSTTTIQVLGDEREPTSKNNPVQTTPVPVHLLQVLSILTDLLVIISDEA